MDMWADVDTAVTVPVNIMPLLDDTDFKTREESVTFDQSGLDLLWNFQTTAGVQTQVAVTPTDTAGVYDWTNVGNGMYKIEIPASGGGTINNDAEGFGWFSGFATGVLPWRGPVIGFRAVALNNSLVDGATIDVNLTAMGGAAQSATDLKDFADAGYDPATNKVTGVLLVDTLTTYTNDTPQSADNDTKIATIVTATITNATGADVATDVKALKAETVLIVEDTGTTIPALIATAQADLNTITGTDGTTLATAQGNYAPSKAGDAMTLTAAATSAQLVDDVWDEALTGATHNVATSSGKRLRQIDAAFVIESGTAQAGSTSTTIKLAASASSDTDIFRGDRVIIIGGTGIGEHEIVVSYNGTTKVATMNEAWLITPDNTSEYELVPATVDVGTWKHTPVTTSSTSALPEMDAKSISDSTAAADAVQANIGNLDASVAGVPTTAEFEARTIVAASYFDPTADTVATVTDVTNQVTTAQINAEVDTALNTAIPGTPTANSVNQRLVAIDALTEASGDGDLASVKTTVEAIPTTAMRGTDNAATATNLAAVDTVVDAILVDTSTTIPALLPTTLVGGRMDCTIDGTGMESGAIDAMFQRQMTESYNADGTAPTMEQAMMMMLQCLTEFAISGTTITVKKLDGSTTAATFTLDDSADPTSRTRAT